MDQDQAQEVWEDYYQSKKAQRLKEAAQLWEEMETSGIDFETVLALDFLLFGTVKSNGKALLDQLSESYEMRMYASDDEESWYVEGTTRPYGITLEKQQHHEWVKFMCDVGRSYQYVFASWSLEAPKAKKKFESEEIESDS